MVDATYKLTNLRMPVYLMLCIDGNGQSEIVACCVTSLETEDRMTAMGNAFKKHNSRWDQVAMVMTDKDMTERTVFGSAFPNATMHLCLFHVLRSFRRSYVGNCLALTIIYFSFHVWDLNIYVHLYYLTVWALDVMLYG